MFDWTENSFWGVVTGLFFLVFSGILWFHTKRTGWLIAAAIALLIGLSAIVVDAIVETDNESLRKTVRAIAQTVENNDVDGAAEFVAPEFDECRRRILAEMPNYNFRYCNIFGFRDIIVYDGNPKTAKVDFIVAANLEARDYDFNGPVDRRVILEFTRSGDHWKITNYSHQDPRSQRRVDIPR